MEKSLEDFAVEKKPTKSCKNVKNDEGKSIENTRGCAVMKDEIPKIENQVLIEMKRLRWEHTNSEVLFILRNCILGDRQRTLECNISMAQQIFGFI